MLLVRFIAEAQKKIWNRDIDWADFVAGAAEAGSLGQIREFLEIFSC